MPRVFLFLLLLCCMPATLLAWQENDAVYFETHVRPILKAHCWRCHGEEDELKGALDTRTRQLLFQGGDSGAAIVLGDHAKSLLYTRAAAGEMPPEAKKLTPAQIGILARWIDSGAKTLRDEPTHLATGDTFTVEERTHWSFQPIRRPPLPNLRKPQSAHSAIDAFLLARLEARDENFGSQADPSALIRRLMFDLTGLPPTPQDVEEFLADSTTNAYERLVDKLLASPQFGERWARHWLDVVGYADSNGYTDRDTERKWAFKYRDYVIRAFNNDQPWDQFLIEQLAGDELLTPPYTNLTTRQSDMLIATGMLRMGPDGTGDGAADQNLARNEVMADTIKIVSTSVLGLTVGCAQCHAHRYDPISHADYHRVRALFEPAYDWQNWRVPEARLVSLWTEEIRQQANTAEAELKDVTQRRNEALDKIVDETLEHELAKLPEAVQPLARAARATPDKERTAEQQQLTKEYPFLNVDRGSVYLYVADRLTAFNKKWDELTEATRKKRPQDDYVLCLTEVPGQVSPTKLFARGDFNQPRQEVAPGELAVLNSSGFAIAPDPTRPTSGRRLAYARHLTDGRHPLVARVLVNRFWLHLFGRGLVATPGDFGTLGEPPSHPDLLDWLADDFMQGGWRLKPLVREIVTSAAYRQSSERRDSLDAIDPENRLLGRMSVRRLEAESIRDSLLAINGRLSSKMFGPAIPVTPDDAGQIVIGVDTRDSAGRPTGKIVPLGEDEFRRTIYVQVRRSQPLGMLEPFDAPLMKPNCELRTSSTVAPQSLLMMNSAFVVEQSEVMAERIEREVGSDPLAQFQRAWLLAYSRKPTEAASRAGVTFLTEQVALISQAAAAAPADPKKPSASPGRVALAQLCHALISSNEFLYVD